MIQKIVLLIACVAACSAGCALDGTDNSKLAANEGDPTTGTLSEEQPSTAASDDVRQTDQALFGSDNCRDVDLRIANYGGDRKIRAVQFKSTSSSPDWVYEDLDDRVRSDGEDHTWTPSLKDAENDHIIWWRVKYSNHQGYSPGGIRQWSPDEYSEPMRAAEGDDIKCVKGSNFSLMLTNANE
jgi:hypothetical protein